ncbi:MAG: methionine adenosyltransferase [Candidatus Omnitrophica bacterium]|nr:methionine adenosyltransferase [Candidatus Omnitrophota bacterium]MDD5771286.1 methionine adenosyltransferase [Candidatus Omnitrophota bacterium]
MSSRKHYFSSESVTEGHPDKLCDQISDGVLDACLKNDVNARVACETYVTMGLLIVGGEITTRGFIHVHDICRDIIGEIGYNHPKYGFDFHTCAILNAIHSQSPDISQGVDTGGAGDQGIMFGYACDETRELMPLALMLAQKLSMRLTDVRKKKILDYLGPDGKTQVTVEYDNERPVRVDSVVLASQHTEDILDKNGKHITEKARRQIIKEVADPILKGWTDKNTKYFVNQTGKFVIGGPQSDTGMTGRKIIVDTYGGAVAHGGGAFSGKDPTKVDRSAAYMCRYIAKNIVAAGLAKKCLVQLAYVIGRAEPLSVMIKTEGTSLIPEECLVKLVWQNFQLTPKGIIESLRLRRPIYKKTASYGHFGRLDPDFTWEKTDKAQALKRQAGRI